MLLFYRESNSNCLLVQPTALSLSWLKYLSVCWREQPQIFTASGHKHTKGHEVKVFENKEAGGHVWA